MPQYIWEGLFRILGVLVPGVVMALFATYYQNKRKREIQIEGKLAVERIDGYEQILSCFYDGQNIHEVTLQEEKKAAAILGYFDVDTFRYQCPSAFWDEKSFDVFYSRLIQLQKDYQLYLDDEASRQLNKSVAFYSSLKKWMDAFCDTEHTIDLGIEESLARANIDWMYKLMGMMMYSHCTRTYAELDRVVCKQMNRFYLTYRRHRIRRALREMRDRIVHMFDVNMGRNGLRGRISRYVIQLYIGREMRDIGHIIETAVQLMRYVHFSDRFTPQEYFEGKRGPSENEIALYAQVFMAMAHKS